ncbi:facilitated trehalose transporter Tret1-like [Oratosquilla oratoria]|uniref:facilitated trehalose transporter Tret1-like n=1 Tax=Oratosquilla oratoria TaxID=337810 RepID=UPI003F758ED2
MHEKAMVFNDTSRGPSAATTPNDLKSVQHEPVFHINLEKSIQQTNICNSYNSVTKIHQTYTQRPSLSIQILATLVIAIGLLGSGCASTYSGATLTELTSSNSTDLTLDDNSAALFASLINVGGLVGSMTSGFMMIALGPRVATLVITPAWLCAWMMIYFANSVPFLLVARFFVGVTKSVLEITPYMYVAEITFKEYRGALSGVIDVSRAFGMMFMYGIGALHLTWRQLALVVGTVTSAPIFIGLLFFHDSPRWLAGKGYFKKAFRSLQFFRGHHYNIDQEYKEICEQVRETNVNTNVLQQLKCLKDVTILKRLGILIAMTFLFQWGGNTVVLSYATVIFNETDSCTDANVCSIAVGAGRTVGALMFLVLVDRVGRRLAFMVPALFCSLSTFIIGVYFYVKNAMVNGEELVSVVSWMPMVAVFLFSFNTSWVVAVFSILPGEVFPLSFRSMGKAIVGTFSNLVKIVVVQSFPTLVTVFDYYTVFWIFSFCAVASAATPLFLLETSAKSLEEIERHYMNKNNRANGDTLVKDNCGCTDMQEEIGMKIN